MIQAEYTEKLKLLISYLMSKGNDHNKNVQTIINVNNNEISKVTLTLDHQKILLKLKKNN